jgi:hypothetical protein
MAGPMQEATERSAGPCPQRRSRTRRSHPDGRRPADRSALPCLLIRRVSAQRPGHRHTSIPRSGIAGNSCGRGVAPTPRDDPGHSTTDDSTTNDGSTTNDRGAGPCSRSNAGCRAADHGRAGRVGLRSGSGLPSRTCCPRLHLRMPRVRARSSSHDLRERRRGVRWRQGHRHQ